MRPVEKKTPVEESGKPKAYKKYQDARCDLITQLGDYCSYCGAQYNSCLAVEHIEPQSKNQNLVLAWDNFLLSCSSCNSSKGKSTIDLTAYYWPHRDNTHKALAYGPGGTVKPHPALNKNEVVIAENTIHLTGLHKNPSNGATDSDRRWHYRSEAWDIAQIEKDSLSTSDTPKIREKIITLAKKSGFWSVWVSVFKNDSDMLERLENSFPGTFAAFQVANIRPRT